MTAVADVLNGAADLIERDGWTQGADWSGSCVCVGKAIEIFAGQFDEDNEDDLAGDALGALECHLRLSSFGVDVAYVGWNDAPGRTQAEVVAALRAAAERAA